MALTQPTSMDELLYFSNRSHNGQTIKAWVYKKTCPECGKAKLSKPKDAKTGRPKIRSKEYVCPECNHTEEKATLEPECTLEATYTCGHCGKEGEGTTQFKRKTYMGVPSYLLICEHCGEKIAITKKMKEPKPKKSKK